MKVGIVGGGVVGQATARSYLEHVEEVRVFDLVPERRTHPLDQVLECDIVFICLPTPQKENSLECDTSAVDKFFSDRVDVRLYDKVNYVLRSTVPMGTTRRLREKYGLTNLVHSPEFLTARCATVDAQLPSRTIIGDPNFTERGHLCDGGLALSRLYARRWPHVPCYFMTADESEAVKLFLNSFFAVKVAYFNEVHALATKLGLRWRRVLDGILSDGRIAPSHTQVPGPDGQFGFGGTCLPKDLANLVVHLKDIPGACVCLEAYLRNIGDRQRTV